MSAGEIAAYAAQMLVEITGDEDAAAAGAEVAMMQLEGFLAEEGKDSEKALPEMPGAEKLDKLLN